MRTLFLIGLLGLWIVLLLKSNRRKTARTERILWRYTTIPFIIFLGALEASLSKHIHLSGTIAGIGVVIWVLSFVIAFPRIMRRVRDNWMIIVLFILYLGNVILSYSLVYRSIYTLHPQDFHAPNMLNPVSFIYYSITTFTTTGYGDIFPLTTGGRVWAMSEMMVGWLSSGFVIGALLSRLRNPPEKMLHGDSQLQEMLTAQKEILAKMDALTRPEDAPKDS
ncbi:MAG: potassium channel family protein [Firmicutes bacterium]|nr:potassium channel family protein [Bacillota bacterium]